MDSSWRYVAQPIAGGPFQRLSAATTSDSTLSMMNNNAALSKDGQLAYFVYRGAGVGQRKTGVLALRLADGASREVLHFDEPARPHGFASNGIAEYGGWLYFTLSDPQSDIWVAMVNGLSK